MQLFSDYLSGSLGIPLSSPSYRLTRNSRKSKSFKGSRDQCFMQPNKAKQIPQTSCDKAPINQSSSRLSSVYHVLELPADKINPESQDNGTQPTQSER